MCMCVCTPNVLGLVTCYPCYPPLLEMPPPSEAPPASPSFVGFGGSSDSRASDAKCRCPGPLFGDLEPNAPISDRSDSDRSMSTLRSRMRLRRDSTPTRRV